MTDPSESAGRLRRLQAQMAEARVDLVAIAPTPNMRYLLGFAPLADERLCLLLMTHSRPDAGAYRPGSDPLER
jgi:Xaa-Pro aminopeptidase